MITKNSNSIPYSGYGAQGLQVFTPWKIETVSAGGSLDVARSTAIRVAAPTNYQINGAGTIGTMPVGCTGIGEDVNSLIFPDGATVEVM